MSELSVSQLECNIAKEYGFEPSPDDARGDGWFAFVKGPHHVWYSSSGWTVAQLVRNHFVGHESYPTLRQAFMSVSLTVREEEWLKTNKKKSLVSASRQRPLRGLSDLMRTYGSSSHSKSSSSGPVTTSSPSSKTKDSKTSSRKSAAKPSRKSKTPS